MERRSRIQLNFRHGSTLLKIGMLAVIVLSTVAMLSMRGAILAQKARLEDFRGQARQLEQENARLEAGIEDLGTVQGVIRIAQEELGMVLPGTVILDTEQSLESGGSK